MAPRLSTKRSTRVRSDLPDSEALFQLRQKPIPHGKLLERTRQLMELTIDFVPHVLFERADATKRIQALRPGSLDVSPEATQVGSGVAFVSGMVKRPVLTLEEERYWFTWMNYLKFRAERNRRSLDLSHPDISIVRRIEADLDEALRVRNHIVESNLRLVVALARKFSNSVNQMSELISEGMAPLIRSAELFDVGTGNHFSTYATWSVRNEMLRFLKRLKLSSIRSLEEEGSCSYENIPDRRSAASSHQSESRADLSFVHRALACLTERERLVILARYGLGGHKRPRSLVDIGAQVGLCGERVRQLITSSLSKLRNEIQFEDFAPLD